MCLRVVIAALGLLAVGCRPAWTQRIPPKAALSLAPESSELVAIAEFEDRRSLGENRIVTLALTANEPSVRRRAFLALARIQDPATAEAMVKGLTDPDAATRAEVAFAIGLLALSWTPVSDDVRAKLSAVVLEAEALEADGAARLSLLEAAGRLGTPALLDRLVERLQVAGDVQARAALSLGVAAKNANGALPGRALPALATLLKKDQPPATRYGATWALMQTKNAAARTFLLMSAADDSSEVRAVAAKGLGEIGTETDTALLKLLIDDPDYRVAVEATRSLAKQAVKCRTNSCAALTALGDLSLRVERFVRGDTAAGGQPLLALAQAPLPVQARPLLATLRTQLSASRSFSDQRVRQDGANLDCRLAAAMDRLAGSISEVMSCGASLIDEPRRLALGLRELATLPAVDPGKRAAELGSFVFHADPRVKLAALELLGETKSQASMDKVKTLLVSTDPVLSAAAALASAKLGDKTSIPAIRSLAQNATSLVDVAPVLAEALSMLDAKAAIPDLEQWLTSPNATVRSSAADALSKLKGVRVVPPRIERPVDPAGRTPLPKNARLLVTTDKGEFEIELFTTDAPLTSANMYALARRGYFRNLTFHRVVPDFVAQGGDPRGDGEGGPGYTIRCEINHRPYARGVVGMALSGKDTGGSQFFVTAAPQPHLDGRYTAFGAVTKGQEIVDALFEGDRIIEVRAVP